MTKNTEDALSKIEPIAKLLGKTAGQIWKIFVMRYVAKGVSEVFIALVIGGLGYNLLHLTHPLWMLAPFGIAALFIYDAIQLLVNPYYFAMDDVAMRLKNENIFKK